MRSSALDTYVSKPSAQSPSAPTSTTAATATPSTANIAQRYWFLTMLAKLELFNSFGKVLIQSFVASKQHGVLTLASAARNPSANLAAPPARAQQGVRCSYADLRPQPFHERRVLRRQARNGASAHGR
ncbi:hypothetical protein SePPVgORF006 [Seal parapoxvirus]|uniref:Uncharacterized protein n=1 Tax=Seal parapoxvirus TaxID=187984 RepID=A0A1Z4CGC7_9POXV|nr:hypothetical protein CGV03_gp006 [Seal parapoxvirus]ASF89959.1 hypothetical protein SePPVgORF006 [Seal parapoxvirus]